MKEHLLYFLSGCLLTALVFTFLQVAFADAPNPGHTADEIEDLPASKITSGVFDTARLGSGTANSSSFLRGDQTWAVGTSTATANTLALRDASGRLKVASPSAGGDATTKTYVDAGDEGFGVSASIPVGADCGGGYCCAFWSSADYICYVNGYSYAISFVEGDYASGCKFPSQCNSEDIGCRGGTIQALSPGDNRVDSVVCWGKRL